MNNTDLFNLIKAQSRNEDGRIILGNLIELKVNDTKDFLDVYKYVDFESEDFNEDEHDFDEDYITSIYLK